MGTLLSKVDKINEKAERQSKANTSYSHVDFLTRLETNINGWLTLSERETLQSEMEQLMDSVTAMKLINLAVMQMGSELFSESFFNLKTPNQSSDLLSRTQLLERTISNDQTNLYIVQAERKEFFTMVSIQDMMAA